MVDDSQSFHSAEVPKIINTKKYSPNDLVAESQKCFLDRDETLVIVHADKRTAFVGRLVEINMEYLAFDYVVLESNLAVYMHSLCEVNLRSCYTPGTFSKSITCKVVKDSYIQDRTFFDIPMRRCILEFTRRLSLSEIRSFV